jgi:quinol monooxygenase YgiN
MRYFAWALSVALFPLLTGGALAQEGTAYVVAYVEVAPASAAESVALLRQLRDASRKEDGVERFEILQRTSHPNHFAVIETWKDVKAAEAHGAAPHTRQFREKLMPLMSAPYDERPHTGLAIGSGSPVSMMLATATATLMTGGTGIFAVTHVDIIPPKKDDGIAALKALADPSRKEDGNVRYEAWQQNSRPNHFTLVEVWQNEKALHAHWIAPHMKSFRDQLLPMSGSLYDERLYRLIE